MDRRRFISSSLAAGAALTTIGTAAPPVLAKKPGSGSAQPNILFIVVDEMRFPSVFPSGTADVGEFLQNYMPNTYRLWQKGVKFANHHTASDACSPSRAVFITGLYSQQNWITQTIKSFPGVKLTEQPALSPDFPTYGKLLRDAGYQTPYIGKWHLSNPERTDNNLEVYGFDYKTLPDPTGANLQGTFGDEPNDFHNDEYVANQAADWLSTNGRSDNPWCLTVCFVNPHDKEFFPAGTEFQAFAELYADPAKNPNNLAQVLTWATEDCAIAVDYSNNFLANPPSYGYPLLPPNWETAAQIAANKPSTQAFGRLFQQLAFGGVSDDPSQTEFTVQQYPIGNYGVAVAPYSYAGGTKTYWQRGLDCYTQVMNQVDIQIGTVLDALEALPPVVAQNTIIVFTADHGDFAGAHGFISGKAATAYREIFNVPLIVADPTGRFAGDVNTIRNQLTSSVDLVTMLTNLGYNGSTSWMTGDYAKMYGRRFNMLPLIKSNRNRGRPYVVFATDELVPLKYIYDTATPLHIVGLVTEKAKLGVYANWQQRSVNIDKQSIELEYYDYDTTGGRAELDNMPNDPHVTGMLQKLLNNIIPNELRASLPGAYAQASAVARAKYLLYVGLLDTLGAEDTGLIVGL